MKKISFHIAMLLVLGVVLSGCSATLYSKQKKEQEALQAQKVQDVTVLTCANEDNAITPKKIEDAFESVGLSVLGNNNMNKPFMARFKTTHYKVYNLAMFMNNELTFKLLKKYPEFGALTPLTMSMWQDDEGNFNVATLSIHGVSRAAQIPSDDEDLQAYIALIQKGLHKAMPNGVKKELSFTPSHHNRSLQQNFTAVVELEEGDSLEDYIEDFESEFESEMDSLGFLLPNYTNVQEDIFDEHNYTGVYDFYHTYSICKLDVIFPVSKTHPEAGAWAPCSFYLYKKVGEKKMHMGFLGVENWISTLDIKDQESIEPLKKAQGMIADILESISQ